MPLQIPTIYLDNVPPGVSYGNPHQDNYRFGGGTSKKKAWTSLAF
jgi:hypothetical protein